MKDGDFVTIDYVGRIKDSGEIFDLTKEELAKKENVYDEKVKYKPVTFIVGAQFIIRGLDEALHDMKVGEKKTVLIPPEKAFGPRSPELVKLMPESQFKQQNIDTTPGAMIKINNFRGRVVSVDGGRVKIDFNHPLAGKELEYEIEVLEEVKGKENRTKALVNYFTALEKEEIGVEVNGEEIKIEIKRPFDLPRRLKQMMADNVGKWVGAKKVVFLDVFEISEAKELTDGIEIPKAEDMPRKKAEKETKKAGKKTEKAKTEE